MRDDATIRDFETRVDLDFASMDRADLEAMAEAGQEALEAHRVLAKTGDNIVGELLKDHETFYEWDHYPPGDVYDRETHSQFYYHAHQFEDRFAKEHGHFHIFLRPGGMPPGLKPAPLADFKMPEDPDDALSHLIAVAMDKQGLPIRLFTVNRWVTGETWYAADDVCAMLDCFKIDHAQPSWPVNRWLSAMVRLFKPQITALVHARDRAVADWQARHPKRNVFEDRDLEVTSYVDISVEEQVRKVARSLMARG